MYKEFGTDLLKRFILFKILLVRLFLYFKILRHHVLRDDRVEFRVSREIKLIILFDWFDLILIFLILLGELSGLELSLLSLFALNVLEVSLFDFILAPVVLLLKSAIVITSFILILF